MKRSIKLPFSGFCAGIINGLFGGGGGMILVPLLRKAEIEEEELFSSSLAIILPICLVSLLVTAFNSSVPWHEALPYLPGSAVGGLLAGITAKRIPTSWLHKGLGILILWGGVRYLC